jgi:regulator of protease activity HflC (stomatin/prohibitin superfamily)
MISVGFVFGIIGGVLALTFGTILLCRTIFIVHTKEAGIVERFGKFQRVATEGLNFKNPFTESLVYREDLAMQLRDIAVKTKTKDDATVTIPVRVQYYVLPNSVKEAYYELDRPELQIQAHVENVILSFIPSLTLDETYQQEDQIAKRIKDQLSEVMKKFGYAIENALVTQIQPAAEVVNAMNEINAARREKVANEAKAESNWVLKVKAAEAEAEAKRLEGVGIANQRKAIIDGLKESIDDFKAAVDGTSTNEVMMLVLMSQYFDTLKDIGQNSNTILFPNSPSGLGDLMSQLRNAVTLGNVTAAEATTKVKK